jgi:hypothetical protein
LRRFSQFYAQVSGAVAKVGPVVYRPRLAATPGGLKRKINLSAVFAGQNVGIKEVSGNIWLVSFMHYDLGFFDHQTCRLEPVDTRSSRKCCYPCLRNKLLPMSPEWTLIYLVAKGGIEPPTHGFSVRCSTN